jgi:hypothetical protein
MLPSMADITVEQNLRTKKFVHIGADALDYASAAKTLTLTQREIMVIVQLYKRGVYNDMLQDGVVRRKEQVSVAESDLEKLFHGEEEPEPVEEPQNYTMPQLRAMCKERGLKGYSKLRKAELMELLEL